LACSRSVLSRACTIGREAYIPAHEKLRSFINEYLLDHKNTAAWNGDPRGEAPQLCESWLEAYGREGDALPPSGGLRQCNKTAARGASACTNF